MPILFSFLHTGDLFYYSFVRMTLTRNSNLKLIYLFFSSVIIILILWEYTFITDIIYKNSLIFIGIEITSNYKNNDNSHLINTTSTSNQTNAFTMTSTIIDSTMSLEEVHSDLDQNITNLTNNASICQKYKSISGIFKLSRTEDYGISLKFSKPQWIIEPKSKLCKSNATIGVVVIIGHWTEIHRRNQVWFEFLY